MIILLMKLMMMESYNINVGHDADTDVGHDADTDIGHGDRTSDD